MEELVRILNYDIIIYIIDITTKIIKSECKILYDKYNSDKLNLLPEPISGKLYNIWLTHMINYTQKFKPLEHELKLYYKEIQNCKDFNILNSKLYLDYKDILSELYALQYSYKILYK